MVEDSFYSTGAGDGVRYLILSDTEQQMPKARCKIVEARKDKSTSGKEFPVLVLENEDGEQFTVCAWTRDVRACIKEWGAKKPTDWGYVTFKLATGGKRYELVPAADQTIVEEATL